MVPPLNLLKNSSRPGLSPAATFPASPSALYEALRLNPFAPRKSSTGNAPPAQGAESERRALNHDLSNLAGLFPNIQFEVLRELLVKFDGDSRLYICVEQLLRHGPQCVKERWQAPPRSSDEDEVPIESSFRSTAYRSASQRLLVQEFRYLSKSTVEAVLAENNSSYARSRPTLKDLSNKTWRATIGNLNIFRKKRDGEAPLASLVDRCTRADGSLDSGSDELDAELQELFLRPARQVQQCQQQDGDFKLAEELNEAEARRCETLYDCECCCREVTFEKMSACTTKGHMVCFDCVRRTLHEALFGQGWARSVDADRGALKCLAPLVDETCTGCISPPAIQQAFLTDPSAAESWAKFEDRLADTNLLKSQLNFVRCPFCSYAEADPSQPSSSSRTLAWHFKPVRSPTALLFLIILLDLLTISLSLILLLTALRLTNPTHTFHTSLRNLFLQNRCPRFRCRRPTCRKTSCLKCQKAWHDPHTCHEPLLISLRTTVEAARTAAIKRTCPRCGLSFVKSSGCNKLTCVCGYSMCYLCRTALGPPSLTGGGNRAETQGYRHFCEHFRLNPGRPCTECRKCDLYRGENEDVVVKRAGEEAELEWKVKEGMVGVEGLGEVVGGEGGRRGLLNEVVAGNWTLQGVFDWVLGEVIEVEF